jgi:hypothetical protein
MDMLIIHLVYESLLIKVRSRQSFDKLKNKRREQLRKLH